MGIFTRVKDIVTANINSLLDKAEDPAKMLRLMMQEMEDTIIDLKSSCAAKMAESKATSRKLKEAIEKVERWEERARLAIERGREDLAREALHEKRNWSDKKAKLEESLEFLDTTVKNSREDIVQLDKKLLTVKNKYRELKERARAAQEAKNVNETLQQASGFTVESKFEQMERHVEKMESDLEVNTKSSLEEEFSRLESSNSIDDELEALKKSMKEGGEQ